MLGSREAKKTVFPIRGWAYAASTTVHRAVSANLSTQRIAECAENGAPTVQRP
jgi:hypothetical protein